MTDKKTSALILAGGLGTRMKSDKPKVLHEICGESLLKHVILNVEDARIEDIGIVVGYRAEMVREMTGEGYEYYLQPEQLGTGHAVMMARKFLEGKSGKTVVLCGDAPLISGEVIDSFIEYAEDNSLDLCVLTAVLDDAKSYGRIIRKDGKLEKIVELKDCDEKQRLVKEVNSGTYIFDTEKLLKHLDDLTTDNAQKEYYITDLIEIFKKSGYSVDAWAAEKGNIIEAANNRAELAKCAKLLREEINTKHMLEGVTIIDPDSTYIERGVTIGKDTVIYPNTIIRKGCVIGKENTIYSSRIENSEIGDGNLIDNCVIKQTKIGSSNNIGPFVHLRPDTDIKNGTRIGNFVEVKNSTVGDNTAVSHLTYIGDGDVGKNGNIGCGVVFVNYDGKNKFRTVVGDNCFIGCNTNLIAPITLGDNVYVAAGSTLTDDVEEGSFAIARARQTAKKENKSRFKKS